jgi:enoyl-CoA hydratase/carnithine racemase
MADEVLYEVIEPGIALVTLNRPEKMNAVSPDLALQLEAAVKKSEADPNVAVVILASSNDRVFCAGADLAAVARGEGLKLFTRDGGFAGFVHAKREKPWIAAVRGSAVAGGMEMSIACDMTVAGEDAKFGLPEPKRGLLAGAGGVTRLPRAIPRRIAIEMVATGDPIDAKRAYELGLVNRVVPVDQILPEALALARKIAENAPLAVRWAVKLARESDIVDDETAQANTAEAIAVLRVTEDWKEGPRAFVEGRAPVWKGK